MKASVKKHILIFKQPSGTSRGVLREKTSLFLLLNDEKGNTGIGECSLIEGLNPESLATAEQLLTDLQLKLNNGDTEVDKTWFSNSPSCLFSYEMALSDLTTGGKRQLYDCPFLNNEAIKINGLVWMGEPDFMKMQIREKIDSGYKCVKLKIAAIEFQEELNLLKEIRREFTADDIQLRVDANGGFRPEDALEKLKQLSALDIHSIEQPIKQNQWQAMKELVGNSPIDIALDEELIGVKSRVEKENILDEINPEYIILKPSLVGGFAESEEWIYLADQRNIGWWVTSALESNVGLNAIAQWTSTLGSDMFQGLGTGQLFTNNFPSPLYLDGGHINHGTDNWNLSSLGLAK